MIAQAVSKAADRLYGYIEMSWFASTRFSALRDRQINNQLHGVIQSVGIAALPVVGILAALTGATAMTQVTALTGQDNDLAQKLLFFGLVFELAPLLTAFFIVARSSAAMASELAVMHLYDEFTALRRFGVPPADFLLLPRIFGMVLALPIVTIFFQVVAVGSGWLAVALLQNQPLLQISSHFINLANPWLILLCMAKSATMGGLIAVIACYHGSTTKRSTQDITGAAIQAVGGGMVAVFLVDIVFALLVYLWG